MMIAKLDKLLNNFPGATNQTRCFLHILNLTAKSIIWQFNVPKLKNGTAIDTAAQALADLAEGLDGDDQDEYEGEEDGIVEDKPLDELLDERMSMDWLTDEEREDIDLSTPCTFNAGKGKLIQYLPPSWANSEVDPSSANSHMC
jgi:hypothetical protein